MSKSAPIARVLVIDDHPIVTQGLRCWLKDAQVKAVLEAGDLTSGYRLFRRYHPDVVIIDLPIRGSVLGSLDVIRRMRAHDPRSCILVFSMHRNPTIAIRALKAGATGYPRRALHSGGLFSWDRSRREGSAIDEPAYLRSIYTRGQRRPAAA
jgi:DNA-binding NarL/FixJ family response regulator